MTWRTWSVFSAIYCIFKHKDTGWILLRFQLFPRYGSPHRFSAHSPASGLFCLSLLGLQLCLSNVSTAHVCRSYACGVKMSKVLQERHSEAIHLKNRPVSPGSNLSSSLRIQTSARLCSGPFKYEQELCDYLLVNYIYLSSHFSSTTLVRLCRSCWFCVSFLQPSFPLDCDRDTFTKLL